MLDVGETLIDETRQWQGWADWLGVPAFTLFGVLGGLAARGEDHRLFLPLLRPGASFDQERAAKEAAGVGWGPLQTQDLYPDVLPCLQALRAAGWRVVVGGNQPAAFGALVATLDLPVDQVTSSGDVGADKPDREFYRRVAALVGAAPEECVHVGDRVDNDVVAARGAGMHAVHLRRGPWGFLHAGDRALDGVPQIAALTELPATLARLRDSHP